MTLAWVAIPALVFAGVSAGVSYGMSKTPDHGKLPRLSAAEKKKLEGRQSQKSAALSARGQGIRGVGGQGPNAEMGSQAEPAKKSRLLGLGGEGLRG